MRATKDGWQVEGTPAEIVELMMLTGGKPGREPAEAKVETAVKTPKRIDWGKAQALKEAGWSTKQIAEELGASYHTVYKKFQEMST